MVVCKKKGVTCTKGRYLMRLVTRIKRRLRISLMNNRTPDRWSDDPLAVICSKRDLFQERIKGIKQENPIAPSDGYWYPYDILGNLDTIEQTLTGKNRDLISLIGRMPVADIGGADGDLSFFLETLGINDIHLVESAALNCSHLSGARILKRALRSAVAIHDFNIETATMLPEMKFGLVFFLGTLYHLKDPFRMLEQISYQACYCLLSTRIARYLPGGRTRIDKYPLAYLLGPEELNSDPSNYFVFSHAGLRRLFERTGWEITDWNTFDNTKNSTPDSHLRGERAFCLLRSRRNRR